MFVVPCLGPTVHRALICVLGNHIVVVCQCTQEALGMDCDPIAQTTSRGVHRHIVTTVNTSVNTIAFSIHIRQLLGRVYFFNFLGPCKQEEDVKFGCLDRAIGSQLDLNVATHINTRYKCWQVESYLDTIWIRGAF